MHVSRSPYQVALSRSAGRMKGANMIIRWGCTACLVVVAAVSTARGAISSFPICVNSANPGYLQFDPVRNTAYYIDDRDGSSQLYGYNLTTRQEFATGARFSARFSVSGDNVIWQPSSQFDRIYWYNLSSKQTVNITSTFPDPYGFGRFDVKNYMLPDLDGHIVVCGGFPMGPNTGVTAFDLTNQTTSILTRPSSPYCNEIAKVSSNVVVYIGYLDGWGLWTKKIDTGIVTRISTMEPRDFEISGNIIVWEDLTSTSPHNIYGYNLSTGAQFPISTDANRYSQPDICGDIVTWLDTRGDDDTSLYDGRVYAYSISTGQEYALGTDLPGTAWECRAGDDVVVWTQRNPDGTTDIYGAYVPEPSCLLLLFAGGGLIRRRQR